MSKYYMSFCAILLTILYSCKSETDDPCYQYNQTLEGEFETTIMVGTWKFKGGKAGTITIRGVDYNDMDCGYQVMDCKTGSIHMNCDGAGVDKELIIIDQNNIEVGGLPYKRVQ